MRISLWERSRSHRGRDFVGVCATRLMNTRMRFAPDRDYGPPPPFLGGERPARILALLMIIQLGLGAQALSAAASDGAEGGEFVTQPELVDSERQYLSDSFDCILMRVSTQFATDGTAVSQKAQPELHCEEIPIDADNGDGLVFELHNLPDELARSWPEHIKYERPVLTIKNVYREHHKLIFTDETIWSIAAQ
ncbi:MAG: hypothetical protein AAF699_11400 [Pseudomonadota bacterium]